MEAEKKHSIGVFDADGNMQVVEADGVRICAPTPKCMKFWATFAACLIAIGVGIFFMIWEGTTSAYFYVGQSLLSLAVGVLIPGPNYEDVVPIISTGSTSTK